VDILILYGLLFLSFTVGIIIHDKIVDKREQKK